MSRIAQALQGNRPCPLMQAYAVDCDQICSIPAIADAMPGPELVQ